MICYMAYNMVCNMIYTMLYVMIYTMVCYVVYSMVYLMLYTMLCILIYSKIYTMIYNLRYTGRTGMPRLMKVPSMYKTMEMGPFLDQYVLVPFGWQTRQIRVAMWHVISIGIYHAI